MKMLVRAALLLSAANLCVPAWTQTLVPSGAAPGENGAYSVTAPSGAVVRVGGTVITNPSTGAAITSFGGGTEYTEDAAAAADPVGTMGLCVRRDTLSTTEVSADGDNIAFKCDNRGQLYIRSFTLEGYLDGVEALLTTMDTSLNDIETAVEDTTTASPVKISQSTTENDVDAAILCGGAACATSAKQDTLAGYIGTDALDAYTDTTGAASGSANEVLKGIFVKVADTSAVAIAGAAAHDAAISGAPVRLGARALTADYTAVTTGDTADLKSTLTGALITKANAIPEAEWTYTSGTTGILSNTTTAVTFKAAAAAGLRNYVTSCQLTTTAFGAAVPIAFRDGAGGTVIFALQVPTAGFLQPVQLDFQAPLRSSAATLLEVVTPTANTSGTVTLNCQGHVAP